MKIMRIEKVTDKITLYNCDCIEFMKDIPVVYSSYLSGIALPSFATCCILRDVDSGIIVNVSFTLYFPCPYKPSARDSL